MTICATGNADLGRLRLTGIRSPAGFRVEYLRGSDGVNITRPVLAGTYLTSRIKPGTCFRYRIDVIRVRKASVGDFRTFGVVINPELSRWATLRAAAHVTASTFSG